MPDQRTQHLSGRTRDFYVDALNGLRPAMLILSAASAMLGVMLNLAGVDLLLRPTPDTATHPTTAACLLLLVAGLHKAGRGRGAAVWLLSAIGIAVAVKTGEAFGPDLIPQPGVFDGRMGDDTALTVILLGLTVLVRDAKHPAVLLPVYTLLVMVVGDFVAISYGLPVFGGAMSPTTLAAVGFAMLAALSFHARRPMMRVVLAKGAIGARTRVMLIVGFIVPWLNGLALYRLVGVTDRSIPVEGMMINGIIWGVVLVTVVSGYKQELLDRQRRQAERALARRAVTDELTGLLNRQGMKPCLERAFATRRATTTAVVLIDLDHFKRINDTYGHGEGDRVLRSFGAALRPFIRRSDTLARWGGEEFLLLLNITHPAEIARLTARLLRAVHGITLRADHADIGAEWKVTASLGVSLFLPQDQSFEGAIRRADAALYRAKAAGRDRAEMSPELALAA